MRSITRSLTSSALMLHAVDLDEDQLSVLSDKTIKLLDTGVCEEAGHLYPWAPFDAWRGYVAGRLDRGRKLSFGDYSIWHHIGTKHREERA